MNNQSSQQKQPNNEPLVTETEIKKNISTTKVDSIGENLQNKTPNANLPEVAKRIGFLKKLKTIIYKIFSNPTSRTIAIAVIVTLIGSSSSYAYYAYQKKKIDEKVLQESESLLTEKAQSQLPEIESVTEEKKEEPQASKEETKSAEQKTTTTNNETNSSSGGSGSSETSSSANQQQTTSTKTINDQAKELKKLSTQNCYAYAPDGWTNVENMQSVGFGYDAYNSDQTLMASYGMIGVPGDQAYFYGYTSAEVFMQALYASIGYTGFSWQGETYDVGDGYKTRAFQATANGQSITAMVLYKTWDIGGGGFILAQRVGTTYSSKWQSDSATAFDVVLSMRCTAQLQQSSGTSSSSSNDSISEMITSSYENRQASLDKTITQWSEAMRGVDNVYSPSTGQHYEAPYSAYSSTGPQGAGYYRSIDSVGGVEKLENGFGY